MHFDTATRQIAALHARKISAVELLDRTIARLQRIDARINAVVVTDFDGARQAAAQADAALARGERRPLLGLPMTVKEAFNVAGLPTTWGIPGTGAPAADQDAIAVRRLKDAGAVIIGKTNVPLRLGDYQSYNAIHGTTNNPWDPTRTPGGSSGGSAAALAAGLVALELGSDLAGSLRVPAHCCGIHAHKPTSRLVPMRGCVPPGTPVLSVGAELDLAAAGPMARSAADLELALDVLAGPDEADAAAYVLRLPPARHAALRDFRVLVLDTHPLLPTSAAVRGAIEQFAGNLARAGCAPARSSPLLPDLTRIAQTFGHLLMAFIGVDMPVERYEQIRLAATRLAPSDRSPAALELRALASSHRDCVAADRLRVAIRHQWRQLFAQWDVVLCPVLPTVAFPHDHAPFEQRHIDCDGQSLPYRDLGRWSALASIAGLPATALPIGFSAAGLPIGIQAIGPYLEDRTPLRFAALVEQAFGGFVAPPGFDD